MKLTHFPPILMLALAAFLVLGGYEWGHYTPVHQPTAPTVTTTSSGQPAGVDAHLLWESWDKLHQKFNGDVDDKKLIEGAISGMVNALGDPYTVYLDPQAAKELGDGLQGSFSGIGAEIGVKNHALVIIAPLADSPAAQAGLKPSDEIQKIDGKPVADMTFVDAIRAIRGPEGSSVTLTIARNGQDPKDFKVERKQIDVKSVTSDLRPDKIGVITISAFHEDTANLTQTALQSFADQGAKGVVLDLRGNPGGLLDSGIDVASLFLPAGVVVKQQTQKGDNKVFAVSRKAILPTTPLVVLVDKGSASAAEIVAGALQDHGRAKLIGGQTFGKGSVQELEDLSNGGQLKITVAHWLTPNDHMINGKGIAPDISVDRTDADEAAHKDPQLDRAVQELKK